MSADFEWRTEEDERWEEPPLEDRQEKTNGRFRWWLTLLSILIVVSLTGLAIYQLLNRRVSEAETAVTSDVLASHNMVRAAAAQADSELFNLQLSGRNIAWTTTQQEMMNSGMLLDRRAFGLHLAPGDPIGHTVSLSPSLVEAEVRTDHLYTIDVGNGLTSTVLLQQTAVYRLGSDQRWLLSPPDNDFWGDWQTRQGYHITLVYPERDAEIGQRLALGLEAKLGEICNRLPDLSCPPGSFIYIHLEREPDSLAQLNDPMVTMTGSRNFSLPAPTLVGTPVDEAGYQALFRGYAAHLYRAFQSWQCCRGGPFYQALTEKQLSDVSIRPWPLTAADYASLHSASVQLADLAPLWHEMPQSNPALEDAWARYALVDFLLQLAPGYSIVQMQNEIATAPDFWIWLDRLSGRQYTQNALEQAWANFLYERAGLSPTAVPGLGPAPDHALRQFAYVTRF